MAFGLFEAAISSDAEVGLARQASADKMAAAIYDVREQLGPTLFASSSMEEFRDKVAMMKNDQSIYKIVGAHLPPVTGTVRRIVGRNSELEKEFKALLATGMHITGCYPGCEENEAHAKKFHNKDKEARRQAAYPDDDPRDEEELNKDQDRWVNRDHSADDNRTGRRTADFDGEMDNKSTFDGANLDGDRPELKPKDNWDGYLNSVDQNGDKVQDRNFISKAAWTVYLDWADSNGLHPMKLGTLDHYAANLSDDQYLRHARAIQAWEFSHQPKTPSGQSKTKLKDVTAAYPQGEEDPEQDNLEHERERREERMQSGHYYAGQHDRPRSMGNPDFTTDESHVTGELGNPANPIVGEPPVMLRTKGAPQGPRGRHRGEEGGHPGFDSDTTYSGGPGGYPHQGRRDPMQHYIAWCKRNNLKRVSAANVAYYSRGNPQLCVHLAKRMKAAIRTARLRQAGEGEQGAAGGMDEWGNPPGLGADRIHEMRQNINDWNQTASRRQGAPDYLQKADDALTQLLNQKAEEFQETVAPLQQALVTVQQATQLQQAQNPMNVLPPPGTVNVMPGGDQGPVGMPAPGAQDLGAAAQALAGPLGGGAPGGDPSGAGAPPGGGMPDAASGPPPAAGGALPPGVDPTQQQTTAHKRGGQGKGRGAASPRQGLDHTAAGVLDLWNKFQTQRGQSGNLGIGGDADYEAFANQFGIGQQALNKLKTHHQTGVTAKKGRGAATEPPNIAEEAVSNQWRQQDSAMNGHGYKFDKGSNHWTKPGYPPIKNHWQHTGGQHDYDPDNPEQEFAPARGHGWEHDSGPSGEPYVRPQGNGPHQHEASDLVDPSKMWNNFHELDSGGGHQNHYTEHPQWPTPHPREASRKEAWMGWGPALFPRVREVTGWNWDNHLNGYLANRPQHFACECGNSFPAPNGFQRCACGRQWNSYVIGTGGSSHEASADKFIVREVPVRPDVIVANREMTSMRKEAPFADYQDFDDCTSQNSGKRSPEAYCGEIKHRTEDKTAKTPTMLDDKWQQTSEGWAHPDGGMIKPSPDHEGKYQLYGPTVSFGGHGGKLAPLKAPHEDPHHLMNWYSWASGEGPKPPGTSFFGAVDPNWKPSGKYNKQYADEAYARRDNPRDYGWDDFDHEMDAQGITTRPKHGAISLIDPRTGGMHTLVDPGELDDGEDAGHPTMKTPPKDWARRGDGARWQRSPIGA